MPEVRTDTAYSAVRLLVAEVVLTARVMGNVLLEALVQLVCMRGEGGRGGYGEGQER